MSADDVVQFANEIGAKEPPPTGEDSQAWKAIFRRRNYFKLNDRITIIKISRKGNGFWGVGKDYIDLLNSLSDYYLILLRPQRQGWVFDKGEVNQHINSKRWKLREADNQYKINAPLPDANWFASTGSLKRKLGISE